MKFYILTAVALLFSSIVFSQAQDENFYLVEAEISWQKAYSTTKTEAQVFAYFEDSELFSVVKLEGKQLVGRLKNHATDPNKTGVAGVPAIVNKTDFKGNVSIQYRVEEKDYVVYFTNLLVVGRGDFLKKKEEQPFEQHFVSKASGKYRPGFLKKPKKVYNTTFSKLFELH